MRAAIVVLLLLHASCKEQQDDCTRLKDKLRPLLTKQGPPSMSASDREAMLAKMCAAPDDPDAAAYYRCMFAADVFTNRTCLTPRMKQTRTEARDQN